MNPQISIIPIIFGLWVVLTAAQRAPRRAFEFLVIRRDTLRPSKASFADATRSLGHAEVRHRGSGHDGYTFVCYSGRDDSGHFQLELRSDDEMGGQERHEVTEFVMRAAPRHAATNPPCDPAIPESVSVITDRGIRIGLTRSQVEHLLGAATRDSSHVAIYVTDEQIPTVDGMCGSLKGSYYDASSELRIVFAANRVVAMWGSRADFC